ncbi:hypothetical protein J4407_02410 [Candidatus Pacearchaeota archaeon]|nr:hypothetical protein [Candidatus Pacearchaeota archaeon]
MPHQCVRCSKIIPVGSKEILEGCDNCKGHFFFYIKDEHLKKIQENKAEAEISPVSLPKEEKTKIEKEIREIAGMPNEEIPIILDIESINVTAPGKYEIDIVNLFRRDRPLIYKIEEGKYIIDLSSLSMKDLKE